jgi:hypothetical protein
MSTATITPPSINPMIAGSIRVPVVLPHSFSNFLLPIMARGVSYQLDAPLVEEPIVEADKFIVKVAIDEHVIFTLTLFGQLTADGAGFQAERYLLHSKVTAPRARAHFVASTVLAVLGFAGNIGLTIPDFGIQTGLDFKPPLAQIGDLIRKRHIAYKLLVLERATGSDFGWPEMYTLEEYGQLTRVQRAIVERVFVGPVDPVSYKVPAIPEVLLWAKDYERSPRQEFGPVSLTSKIFNQHIPLGNIKIIVEDAYIVDSQRVLSELAQGDGHEVEVVISSRGGLGLYEAPEAPKLPASPWDQKIEALISLEGQLDDELAERYNSLAAATLAGATDEEREILTARPELDDEAFASES